MAEARNRCKTCGGIWYGNEAHACAGPPRVKLGEMPKVTLCPECDGFISEGVGHVCMPPEGSREEGWGGSEPERPPTVENSGWTDTPKGGGPWIVEAGGVLGVCFAEASGSKALICGWSTAPGAGRRYLSVSEAVEVPRHTSDPGPGVPSWRPWKAGPHQVYGPPLGSLPYDTIVRMHPVSHELVSKTWDGLDFGEPWPEGCTWTRYPELP